jgi:hypothetical protein
MIVDAVSAPPIMARGTDMTRYAPVEMVAPTREIGLTKNRSTTLDPTDGSSAMTEHVKVKINTTVKMTHNLLFMGSSFTFLNVASFYNPSLMLPSVFREMVFQQSRHDIPYR